MMGVVKTPRTFDGKVEMTVLFDTMTAEIFAEDGVYSNSTLVFPNKPYSRLRISGASAEVAELA
jgi:hypothetical protein